MNRATAIESDSTESIGLGAITFGQPSLLCSIGQPCGQNVDMLTLCISAAIFETHMHAGRNGDDCGYRS